MMFEKMLYAGWGDMDLNSHMRNTAFLDKSGDGSKFILRNEFYREDGKIAAKVTSAGGWLNLIERKLVAPPEALFAALSQLQKTEDYEVLRSSIANTSPQRPNRGLL